MLSFLSLSPTYTASPDFVSHLVSDLVEFISLGGTISVYSDAKH